MAVRAVLDGARVYDSGGLRGGFYQVIVRMGGRLSMWKVGAINFLLQMIAKREGGEIRQLHPIDSDSDDD